MGFAGAKALVSLIVFVSPLLRRWRLRAFGEF
jgi:hypothetical protein